MGDEIELAEVDQVDGYGLLVSFSDGTRARYTVEELLELRPYREPTPARERASEPFWLASCRED